ncbi:hypothetical protein SLA2020_156650 [Shorea laevis]
MNKNIFTAVVLDARHKLGFVQFLMVKMFGEVKSKAYREMVRVECFKLFEAYKSQHYSNNVLERSMH